MVNNPPILVSVIVPVYNGEKFIAEAIDSIKSQKYPGIEIIIIDDGSTDRTKRIIDSYKDDVRYYFQKNKGPAAARNVGIQKSRGSYIAFLDVDDIWPQGRLELLLNVFIKNRQWEIVLGHICTEKSGQISVPEKLLQPYIMPLFGCGMFKRGIFDKVGLIDESLAFSEDHDWFLRVKEKKILLTIIKEVTLIKRAHRENMTSEKNWKGVDILKVLRQSIKRRKRENKDSTPELPKLSDYFNNTEQGE